MGVYRCLTLPTNSDELSRCSYVNQTHAARRSYTLPASRSFTWPSLLIDGYATVERRRINVGGREKSVPWLQITDAGRKAIAA
jgi:hypothetical protein